MCIGTVAEMTVFVPAFREVCSRAIQVPAGRGSGLILGIHVPQIQRPTVSFAADDLLVEA